MKKDKLSRRDFVAGTTGASVGAMIVPRHVLGGVGYTAPSDTVNFALIGCGGQGKTDAGELVSGGQNLVAMCDVDYGYVDREIERTTRPRPNRGGGGGGGFGGPGGGQGGQRMTPEMQARMQQAAEERRAQAVKLQEAYKTAKRHTDFRKMLESQKDIDAIVVATPDHTHAVIARAAMELGKHAYVEKPLTWSIHEARVLRETAARTKVATQMGNMGHSSEGAALVNEWIQAGLIGQVREVNVWTNRPLGFWPQGVPRPGKPAPQGATASGPGVPGSPGGGMGMMGSEWDARRVNRALAAAMDGDYPAPAGVDWDLFLGPAPEVAYHPIYHPFNWRGWTDWGTGAIGDMAAHLIDHPYWALGLTYPTSVEATFTPFGTDEKNNRVSYPMGSHVVYQFPARGAAPPVKLTWFDGGLMPARPAALPDDVQLDGGGGAIFIGEKGVLVHGTYASNPKLYPMSLMEAAAKVPKTFFRVEKSGEGPMASAKHRMNWIN
ncbi:MAG: Gfo/Idh/MocA family protein, partial [Blastocatellia bacterium]